MPPQKGALPAYFSSGEGQRVNRMAPRKDSASPADRPQGGATAGQKAALKSAIAPLVSARTIERPSPRDRKAPATEQAGESLEQCVFRSLEQYFADLAGAKPHALHEMVLGAIEKPLLQFALQRCDGNQSAAADLLGINRNTLRRKLQDYGLH